MLNAPEPACLVIADISGYTSYLAGVELDHAQDILADLMGTVVGSFRPAFKLAKLEGDAAFVFAIAPTVDGSALQDTVEQAYVAFRRRLRDIKQSSTCECNACIRIPSLDLKVIAHHGEVVRQRIAGREELAGRAVIEVHRLLKNDVHAALGMSAYALYSQACVSAMGSMDPAAGGLVEHRETYEHLGDLTVWVRDLTAVWDGMNAATRVFVEEADAIATFTYELPGPPALVWEYETSPARRPQWQEGVIRIEESSIKGRRGVGTVSHCVHGKNASVEEILDWRPFEYWTFRSQIPNMGIPPLTMTDSFEAVGGGTRLTVRVLRPRGRKDRLIVTATAPFFRRALDRAAAALAEALVADLAHLEDEGATAPEPEVAASQARYLREPRAATGVDSGEVRSS